MKQSIITACILTISISVSGQCVESNLAGTANESGSFEVGQSFIAPCSGELEFVEFFSPNTTSVSGTLKVRNGSTINGTPIYTQTYTNVPIAPDGALRIDLTSPFNLFGGNQYTVSMNMSGAEYGAGNPYGGGRFWLVGSNIPQYATRDLNFRLSIDPSCTNTTSMITTSACFNYTSPSGAIWDSTGVYTDTIFNVAGCDSIITIDLDLTVVDVSVTNNGGSLTANATNSTYQWIEDCNNNQDTIPGATGQTFVPTTSGAYAVWVNTNGCTNLSNCIQVIVSDINEMYADRISIYPNPCSDHFRIDGLEPGETISVFHVAGESIELPKHGNRIEMEQLSPGMYYVLITDPVGNGVTIPLVKMR
jgi:hypothetical protein